ncbi:MobF family relaxase [Agrobacterium tumefaciens]|uniref:MobF family relaxase n=1 Tax=Agrobacterium tumefaciens TaxID=358 RepID=UPI001574E43E|nr:AAA family ATPase [Agrobacterium tumefaciens]
MYSRPVMVSSVEYYRTQDKRSRAENMQYYTDNEAAERDAQAYGVWKVPTNATGAPLTSQIENGQPVVWETIDKVSRGINPDNGEQFFERTKANKYVAIDATNSAPKPVSILYGMAKASAAEGGPNSIFAATMAAIILKAHTEANDKSMDYLYDIGAFQTRQGAGSKERAGATYYAVAQFTHFTSRDGDMQLHTHNVIPNAGRREDGQIGALDNYKFNAYRGAASALYRAEMFQIIKREFAEHGIGVSVSKDGRNLTIDGVSDDLCTHFSKRRKAILEKMQDMGFDGTANNMQAAQIASYDTRGKKESLPPIEDLYKLWNLEAKSLGHSFESVIENVNMTAQKVERERAEAWSATQAEAQENGEEIAADPFAQEFAKLKKTAAEKVLEFESAFEGRQFLTSTLEQLQAHVGADEALRLYEEVKAESGLVEIGTKGRAKEAVYSTEAMMTMEFEILDMAKKMQGNLSPIPHDTIAARLAQGITPPNGKTFWLKPEQEGLVYAMLGQNQLNANTGDAGTGKTTTMVKVREIAEDFGLKVHIAGPTNRSVDVLQQEVGIDRDNAYSIARLIMDYNKGKLQLSAADLVIIDEAGMIGSREWHSLSKIAYETGARFSFVGDYKQLPPVAAGAPMRAVVDLIGGARLTEIARQDEQWQREASKALADNRIEDAITAYSDQGSIIICDDADDVEKRTVDRYFDLKDTQPGSIVVLATTNAEVARLNMAIRERKIERGELTGDSIEIEAITRGKDGRRTDLALMTGDRIIIGETVKLNGERIANNSFGTVESITQREGEEPLLKIKWDDGRTMQFTPSEFVGYREEDDPLRKLPRIAIADAMTFYASQGMTAKHCINASRAPLSTEDTYVGMTRHKTTYTAFIDGARHANDLATGEGKTFTMSKTGGTKQEDDEPEGEATRDDIIKNYVSECSRASGKNNACDFLGGSKEFSEKFRGMNLGNREDNKMSNIMEATEKQPAFLKNAKPKTEAQKLKEQMERVANAPKETPKAKGGLLAPAEIDVLVRTNLADYMLSNGASYAKGEKQGKPIDDKNTKGGKAHEYSLTFGKGQGAVVIEKANGSWGFFMRDGTKGDIRNFVQWRDGGSFGAACAKLRDEFKTIDLKDPSIPYSRPERPAAPTETAKQRFDRLLSETYVAEKFAQVKAWWNEGREAVSQYLLGRGIEKETQAAFRRDFRCEGAETYDAQNKGGVMFAMKQSDGELTGFLRKGPRPSLDDKRDFSKNADGTERHMIVLGDPMTAKRIYVGEPPIDGLTLFQKDGRPEGSAIMATSGSAPERGLAMVYKIAKENPNAEWVWVGQNDDPNPKTGIKADEYNEGKVREAITEGNAAAKIDTRRPPIQFKDWNDEHRGIAKPIQRTAEQIAVFENTKEAYEARKVEIVRKAEKTAEAKPPEPTKGPKGPSMG